MALLFPGFLWAGLGIAIPVLVHLLQLRRPQRVRFTNTGFIREIELKTGRRRLQDLLVLALRISAVAFLVLAFCQPIISMQQGAGNSGQPVQIFVDNSASMQQPGLVQQQVGMQAVQAARTVGASYAADVRFQLLSRAGKLATKAAFLTEVAAMPQQRQMGWGSAVAQDALQADSRGPLYVVSDFQKSEVKPAALGRLASNREIILVPQGTRPTSNVFVDSVWLNDAFARSGENSGLHIRLRNGGSEASRNCPVKVLLNSRQVAAFQTTVAAGQAAETVVQVALPAQPLITGQVQVAEAPVTFDNTYYFALQPASAVRVVEIGPEPVTQAAYMGEKLFRYSYMRPRQVDFGRLRDANLVLLSEAVEVDAGLREALVAAVRRGISLVIVPAPQPAAREATTRLLRELSIGGVQWLAATGSTPIRQEVALPNVRAPFFKDVFGAQPRQVAMPSASPVLQLTGAGTDVLRLRDGGGFLTEFAQGEGRIYVFAAPFDKAYSDFKAHALFVPVLYRLAMLSYRNDQPLAYRVGQAAVGLLMPQTEAVGTNATAYRLVRDSLTLVPAQRQQGQQLRLEIPTELTRPGFYQLQQQGKTVATLAFNAPKAESELTTYSAVELRQLVGNRPNVHVLDAGEQPATLLSYRAEQSNHPLWRYCLLLALASLLAEGLMLRWGRRAGLAAPSR